MRELKFRIYDSNQKKLVYFDFHNITVSDRLLCQYDYPVQQFTGLTDCKGNNIYEGDIIKETHFEDWQDKAGFDYFGVVKHVVYTDKNNGLQVSTYSSFPKSNDRLGNAGNPITVKCEVIGNIFGFPCRPDHNGECLICDCWLSDCPMVDLVKLDKAKKVK
jgi:uncharacterized phage protein (TIGR01671 family)